MTEQKSVIDYANEANQLVDMEDRNWWAPSQGQHVIELMSEGDQFEGTDYNGNPVQKVRYKIKVNNQDFDWTITKSKTKTGLWGQLVLLIRSRNNQAVGTIFNLVVKGEKKARQYTILEALPLLPKK